MCGGHEGRQVEPQAGAARLPRTRRIGPVERFTNVCRLFLRQSGAMVDDIQNDAIVFDGRANDDRSIFFSRVTQGVTDEILDQIFSRFCIGK